jgi:hypothetical protein
MSGTAHMRRLVRWSAGSLGLAAGVYGACVATAWYGYGDPAPPGLGQADTLLVRFIPEYEVAERHQVRVMASAEIALSAAAETDLQQSPLIRAIFRAREFVLGGSAGTERRPNGLLAEMESLGWRVLATEPGREMVVGAVTQPWLADVVFRGVPGDEFRRFGEPDYVKIAWTLRADPLGPGESIFRTQTRVFTTDVIARSKFRWYWARFSPGIILIRRVLLAHVKQEAERRGRVLRERP